MLVLGQTVDWDCLGKIMLIAVVPAHGFPLKTADDGIRDMNAVFRNMEGILHDLEILVHHDNASIVNICNRLNLTV